MNPLVASVIGLVTLLTVVSAQQGNCGCAPAPTIIQLSCGGGKAPSHPPPPPPPPAGSHPEEMMNFCEFDDNGFPVSHPPGGFPEGFRLTFDEHGYPNAVAPPEYPVPPRNWDGSMETLGFTLPQPGTKHYNMLLCYPIPIVTI